MKVIGLTGGIGTGKSTVTQFLAELGAVILDADKIGHEAFAPGTKAFQEVVNVFGPEVVTNGKIDREKLGKIVFNNPEARSRLNRIMHPQIREMIVARLEEYRKQGINMVVVEAALLLEAGWNSLVDQIWVAVAPQKTVLQRLEKRSGLEREKSLARIRAQLPQAEREKHAHVIIDTDCSLEELRAKVKRLWQSLRTENKG